MNKTIVCFVLVVNLIIIPFTLTATADDVYNSSGKLQFLTELTHAFTSKTNPTTQTGDEFYNWVRNTRENDPLFDSLCKSVRYEQGVYNDLKQIYSLNLEPVLATIAFDGLGYPEGMNCKTALVNRQMLNSCDLFAIDGINNGLTFVTLDDLGLTFIDDVSNSEITVSGDPYICNMGTSFSRYNTSRHYNSASLSNNEISIYKGGSLPPAFYAPNDGSVLQNNVALPKGFYIILGGTELIRKDKSNYSGIGAYYFRSVENSQDITHPTVNSVTFGLAHINSSGYFVGKSETLDIYKNGSTAGQTNTNEYMGWELVDLWEKLQGYTVYYDEDDTPLPDNGTFLPRNIPYDDNDYVVAMIPMDEDNGVNTGGDVVYMSPSDYEHYVNNGDIVIGDYVNDYSDTTTNDMTNNYNSYVVNNYYNTEVNSTYDDSALLDKLDTIIGKLNDIKNGLQNHDSETYDDTSLKSKLDTIISKLEQNSISSVVTKLDQIKGLIVAYDDSELKSKITGLQNKLDTIIGKLNDIQNKMGTSAENLSEDMGEVFSGEPVYNNFGDCISNNIPLVNEVKNVINGINVNDSANGTDDIWNGVPSSSGTIPDLFRGFTIDMTWYSPYRIKVRNILKIGCYILGIGGIWLVIRSVFGVQTGGGGDL